MKKKQAILSEFRENPDNPSAANAEEIARLAEKIKANPSGLRAMRVAYVTDAPGGGKMVISGNKRLRVLKEIYGEGGEVPSEWFVDVTDMTEEQRHKFIVDANISDGHWDYDKLLEQYSREELIDSGFASELLDSLSGNMFEQLEEMGEELGEREATQAENGSIVIHIPGEYMAAWRSYNRKNGTDKVVEFVINELKDYKKGQ